jgi:peptidoglycan/xylan/chitin deacetylase (PgdA/CDA1 family)/SAM-dependent methyltransferase
VTITVVVPAYNAEETLGAALDSVLAQTFTDWAAVVVDDGSTDATADIAGRYAKADPRIRLLRQPRSGKSLARNAGIAASQSPWLLFLDADDWLLPRALEALLAAADVDARLDGAFGRWSRATPAGEVVPETYSPDRDLFATLARFCPFAIHACLVRRAVVERVGAFEPSLRTCEDWDVWQRVARTGARFASVDEVLVCYRMRPGSESGDPLRLLEDGLRTIAVGHGPDPRVTDPHPDHAGGVPADRLAGARLAFSNWVAGLLLGHGRDPVLALAPLVSDCDPTLSPSDVAHSLFKATLLPRCEGPAAWVGLWPHLESQVDRFLRALEAQSQTGGLAVAARRVLERLVLDHADVPLPLTIGRTHAVALEITKPVRDVRTEAEVDRLRCAVTVEGERLGRVELPVCDGFVPARVVADALAAEFAWPILGRFFRATLYGDLPLKQDGERQSVWRGSLCLVPEASADADARMAELHARAGWTVFLQEVWGLPTWDGGRFYDGTPRQEPSAERTIAHEHTSIEVSDALADLVVRPAAELTADAAAGSLTVELTVGGMPIALVALAMDRDRVPLSRVVATLTSAGGFELCRIAVREAIIGRPLRDGSSLRARLATAARRHAAGGALPSDPFVAGWEGALSRAKADGAGPLILARHAAPVGTSASRVAMLPAGAATALREAAVASGEPVIELGVRSGTGSVMYAPDLLWGGCLKSTDRDVSDADAGGDQVYDRHHFETVFAEASDPWHYESPFERLKYEQTLSMLTPAILHGVRDALELGCAEGRFTTLLASRVPTVLATDISEIALRRAATRCAAHQNVRFARLDLLRDQMPGKADLIVCSEVLYYVNGERELASVANKLAAALRPGGYLVAAHTNCVVDEPHSAGLDWDVPFGAKRIGEILGAAARLSLVRELRTDLYRVQLFKRVAGLGIVRWMNRRTPAVVETGPYAAPPERVASKFLMHGGAVRRTEPPRAVTDRLPILMYHRVAPAGLPATARYRVTPEAFEGQLSYLRGAGFRSIALDTWRRAGQRHQPLPGRGVVLTFDVGYADFAEHAAPLLARYEFTAIVFLVADHIGQMNSWDDPLGDPLPLLQWPEILRLRAAGIEFGSHSASHQRLTALPLEAVTREAARSRETLVRGLGQAVPAFAYPYGAEDAAVQHLVGACGYVYGLTCRPGRATLSDSLLGLPRVEVLGTDTLEDFVRKLS